MTTEKSFTPGLVNRKSVNVVEKSITFELRDYTEADKFTVAETFTVAISDLDEGLVTTATLHGLSQKVGDAGASKAGTPEVEKFHKKQVEWNRLKDEKSWNKKSTSAAPKVKVADVVRALNAAGTDVKVIASAVNLSVEAVELIISN